MTGSPNPFLPFFRHQGFVLLDGGLATALEDRGHDLRDPLWSARVLLEAPEEVRAVHRAYLEAGADCIATVTYQATFQGLARRGLTDTQAQEALETAVRLAVEARDDFWGWPENRVGRIRPLVAASVGPYGAYLADGSEYRGDYGLDEDALVAWHRRRWDVLAASPVDLLGCETIPSLSETRALARLLAETPERWAWISFQCADEAHLADGTPLREASEACAASPRVAALGVNCVPPARVAPLVRILGAAGPRAVAAYPNAGETYDPVDKVWRDGGSGDDPAALAPRWHAQGVTVLGGCCRTGPETIRAMRLALTEVAGGGNDRERG